MSSGTVPATPSDDREHRASRPGARWTLAAAAIAVLVVAGTLYVVLKPSGSSSAITRYGPLPSWLPKSATRADKNPVSSPEVATPAKPVLSEEQGFTVHAVIPSGSVDITAVGPQFPAYVTNYAQNNLWPAGRLVPSTFYVTLTNVKGTVPLSARNFSVLTGTGQIVRAQLKYKGGGAPPAVVHAGQSVTFEVDTRTLEGQGSIRWAPLGEKVLVGWIYQLELD